MSKAAKRLITYIILAVIFQILAQTYLQTKGSMGHLFPMFLQFQGSFVIFFLPVFTLFILSVILISMAAFIVREMDRSIYGLIEIGMGVVIALYTTMAQSGKMVYTISGYTGYLPELSPVVMLVVEVCAGTFVIVRGLDSIKSNVRSHSGCINRLWSFLFPAIK